MPVAASNPFVRFYTFLAKMGLVIRDDPPRVIDMAGREWGEAVDGLVLSVRELPREDAGSVTGISVVMKNAGASPRTLSVPAWIHYFEIEGVEPTPYGRSLLVSARTAKKADLTIAAGGAIEAELPIGRIYNISAAGVYPVRVSCRLPDQSVLRSNRIEIRV
jgi:hypothetical protein